MEAFFEHRMELAGHSTRALEIDGAGPGIVLLHGWGDSADVWRPLLGELAARDRRAIAVDLPGFGRATKLQPGAGAPAARRVRRRPRDRLGGAASRSSWRAARSAAASRCAWPSTAASSLAGVVPVAPDGLETPSWFDAIEQDPIVRKLLAIPVPVPNVLVRGAAGGAYRKLAFLHPSESQRAVVDAMGRGDARDDIAALMASGRDLLPELSGRPVRPRRDPLPRHARVGRPRPRAAPQRARAWRSARCPRRRSS